MKLWPKIFHQECAQYENLFQNVFLLYKSNANLQYCDMNRWLTGEEFIKNLELNQHVVFSSYFCSSKIQMIFIFVDSHPTKKALINECFKLKIILQLFGRTTK